LRRAGGLRAFFSGVRRNARAPKTDARVESLTQRVEHLERLVEGLQDSVYRESKRQEKNIQELQRKTEPGELARSLDKDARRRGI
jgi:hypothetical protein